MAGVKRVDYSVVIPIYNEEGNILGLDREIREVMNKLSKNYEVIYVNDGSRDNSLKELLSLKKVKIINMNGNYGQTTAFDAGFKAAQGEIVISMDGDGQNDPHDIPKLLEKMRQENLDVVAGWRKDRKDKGSVRVLTHIGRILRRYSLGDSIHDSGCALRVYTKSAIKSLDIGGEMHRYIVELLRWKGFRVGEVVTNHRPRLNGKSKYGMSKAVRGFIDMVYMWFMQKYSQRPLHVYGYMSIFAFFGAILAGLATIYEKIFLNGSFNRSGWFFISLGLFLVSIMLFSFGLVIDMLLKIQFNTSLQAKRYYIREVIEK